MLKRLILPAALLLATGGTFAQQPASQAKPAGSSQAQPALTKEQQEFRTRMAKNAQGVAETVDQGNIASLWDQSSDVMKHAVTRDAFVSGVQAQRTKAGKMESRKLVLMFRSASKGENGIPPGNYFNVKFATKFSNNQKPILETVSYHFDKDNVVRLAGYTLETPAAPKQTKGQ
jgi:hypothetical protein